MNFRVDIKDDKAMVVGNNDLDGKSVLIDQRGGQLRRQYRNFGMSNPDGYRKALRTSQGNMLIICLIDTLENLRSS